MNQQASFGPVFAMFGLTLVVWILMYLRRRACVLGNPIRLRDIATPETLARALDERAASPGNNFRNLCELPVLFYVLGLSQHATGRVDRVSRRFLCDALAAFAFWAMALRAALQYLT